MERCEQIVLEIAVVAGASVILDADQWFGVRVPMTHGLMKDTEVRAEGDTILETLERVLPKAREAWETMTGKKWGEVGVDD
jgi:hypothetical protein